MNKILVPLDGSPLADRILAQVRRILVREDAEQVLRHCPLPLLLQRTAGFSEGEAPKSRRA